jgi:uncharacterized protein YdaU (DUF1376 family)
MAKDPAVLFYTSDFISGTLTMTNEQRGKYILLLCLQHQQGILYENDMKSICGEYDEKVYSKFELIDGKYINLRMKEETEKRRNYCESRGNNKKGKLKGIKIISKSYDNHMENENVIINKNINKDRKFTPPTYEEVFAYATERGRTDLAKKFFDYYTVGNWKDAKGNQVKVWKQKFVTWENKNEQPIEQPKRYREV